MQIKTISVGPLATNCYIVSAEKIIIIDPGAEADIILGEIKKLGLKTTHIIYTHAHWDHTGAGKKVKDATGAEVLLGTNDMDLFKHSKTDINKWLELEGEPAEPDRLINNNETIVSDGISLKVINTPGHTPGGISLFSDGILICGDTLFLNSVGRTDLPGGSINILEKSIKDRIYTLDDKTRIFPGHGPQTSVEWEKNNNPFVKS